MASSKSSEENVQQKNIYYEKLSKYFSDVACDEASSRNWGSRLWINNMIKRIKEAKKNTSNVELDKDLSVLLDTFTVSCNGGNEALFKIVKMTAVQYMLQVVPWEDSLDIILQAHIASNHGDIVNTEQHLKTNKLCVNPKCLETFIDLCVTCNNSKQELIFNRKGVFQVVDMTSSPDGEFSYILVYVDVDTKLIQLRGLMQNSDVEIAMELFKIFMDLGPPQTLIAHKGGHYINVIKMINKLCYPCNIMLDERDCVLDRSSEIKALVNSWKTESKSSHWEIGCHVIQWKINHVKNDVESPYTTVFGRNHVPENTERQKVHTPSIPELHIEEKLGFSIEDIDIKYEVDDSNHITDEVSELMEENLIDDRNELGSYNNGTHNKNVDSMKEVVNSNTADNEANEPVAEKECENFGLLGDNHLQRPVQNMPDIKEDLIEVPEEDSADAQKNVDPLVPVKDENISIDILNEEIQNVHNKNKVNTGTEAAIDANGCKIGDFDTSSACDPMFMDVGVRADSDRSKVASDKDSKFVYICKVCNTVISRNVHTCYKCKRKIHLFCCRRVTGSQSANPKSICLICVKKKNCHV